MSTALPAFILHIVIETDRESFSDIVISTMKNMKAMKIYMP